MEGPPSYTNRNDVLNFKIPENIVSTERRPCIDEYSSSKPRSNQFSGFNERCRQQPPSQDQLGYGYKPDNSRYEAPIPFKLQTTSTDNCLNLDLQRTKEKVCKRKRVVKRKSRSCGCFFIIACLVLFVFFIILGVAVYLHSEDPVKYVAYQQPYSYQQEDSYYEPPSYEENYKKDLPKSQDIDKHIYFEKKEPKLQQELSPLQKMTDRFHGYLDQVKKSYSSESSSIDVCNSGFTYDKTTQSCVRGLPDSRTGIDYSLQMKDASPCNNFYQYACGMFEEEKRGRDQDATFSYMYKRNRNVVQNIIKDIVAKNMPNEQPISAFYHSCIAHSENTYHDKSQLYVELLNKIDMMGHNLGELTYALGELQKYDLILPIEFSFELDPLFGKHLIPFLQKGGVFDTYMNLKSEAHATVVLNHVIDMGVAKDTNQARNYARQIIEIEQLLADYGARVNGDRSASRSQPQTIIEYVVDTKQYERADMENDWYDTLRPHLAKKGFDLDTFFEAARPEEISSSRWRNALKSKPLWCHSIAYLEKLPEILESFSTEAWKLYLKHAVYFQLSPYGRSSSAMNDAQHYTYNMAQDSRYVLPWLRPRKYTPALPVDFDKDVKKEEQECIRMTEAYLPALIDRYYLRTLESMNEADMEEAKQIAEHIKSTFLILIEDSRVMPYLLDSEREELIRKFKYVETQIGAPNKYNAINTVIPKTVLELDPENFAENVLRIRSQHIRDDMIRFVDHAEMGTPVSSDELFDGLLSLANAYYIHQLNAITLNTGLLQPPLYSQTYEMFSKYARMGFVAGHEYSHILDTVGTYFDSNGTINKWMSETTEKAYKQRVRCFVELYNGISSKGTQHDGYKTLNENIADITAIQIAWRSAFSGKYSNAQDKRNFMLAYAQMYCESLNVQQERGAVLSRSHSLGEFRVNNVLGQLGEFSDLWECYPTDYMSNVRKCSIL